jgi:hypothetical protein
MAEHSETGNPRPNKDFEKSSLSPALANLLRVLGAVIIGAVLVVPFYFSRKSADPNISKSVGLIGTHDLVQHIAVMQDFDKVLRSGVLYPRWLPDINNGYGTAWSNFYPPVFFYLSSLFNAVLKDWGVTLFVLTALGFAASGLAFYLLARTSYGAFASTIGALLYMLLPYHVINIYWQGAMPQLLGFVFLPLVLYFAFRLGSQSRACYYAGLGLVYGIYLMAHFPVAYLMAYTLAAYAVIWAALEKDWRIAFRIAVGMGIGFLLASIYLLPAALEARFAEEHYQSIFPYHLTYITLLPLEGFGNLINLSFTFQTLAIVLAIFVFRPFRKPANELDKKSTGVAQTRLWLILAAATTFMNTSFSIYASKLIPKIEMVLFAWRWMAIASLFASLAATAVIEVLRADSHLSRRRRYAYAMAIGVVIASNLWLTGRGVILGALANPKHNQPAVYVDAEYTPRESTAPQNLPETAPVVIQPETGTSEIIRWEPDHREIAVRLDQPVDLRIKTYNFPGWTARIDGEKAQLSSDKDGVQVVSVPEGRHRVETTFVNTPSRTVGVLLSALGFLTVIGLTVLDGVRESRAPETRLYSRLKPVAIALAILLIGAALVLFNSRRRSSNAPAAKVGGFGTVVADAKLHVDGASSVLVASDEKSLGDLMNALPTRDESKVDALVQSGQVLRIANDTPVRVLEHGTGKTRIRILEGEHLMAEVWAPERWVR